VRRKEQAAASRAALVDAAAACFAEEGYEATTVAAVLDRVGMARGALYHYFPGGKRELFFAVFEAVNEAFHRRRDAVASIESPLGRIRAGARVFLELATEDRFARILLVDAPEIVPGQGERGSTFALLQEQLAEAQAAGEIVDVDLEVAAIALFGAIRSAGETVMAAPDQAAAVSAATRVVGLLLDGLAADPAKDDLRRP
jgi:AcrR family transcriptional regulator